MEDEPVFGFALCFVESQQLLGHSLSLSLCVRSEVKWEGRSVWGVLVTEEEDEALESSNWRPK